MMTWIDVTVSCGQTAYRRQVALPLGDITVSWDMAALYTDWLAKHYGMLLVYILCKSRMTELCGVVLTVNVATSSRVSAAMCLGTAKRSAVDGKHTHMHSVTSIIQ